MAGTGYETDNECTKINDCSCAPFEFVRPRFYYGQRLGALDFSDWLWYHAGKQRFHNLHAHGVGVLCGLLTQRYEIPQEDTTTVLKVTKGAALDSCGREVIVSVDQCIDVGAWYLQHHDDPAVVEWVDADDLRLCIGLRYQECPSDPSPAPRDPCGCGDGGCEYGRVREGFELRLFTPGEMAEINSKNQSIPDTTELLFQHLNNALVNNQQTGSNGDAIMKAMRSFTSLPCAMGDTNPWIWLACFNVEIVNERIQNIISVDNTILQRPFILSTSDMQALLLALSTNAMHSGLIGTGPQITGFQFSATGASSGEIELAIDLVMDETGLTKIPLSQASFNDGYIHVQRFDPANGWQDASPDANYRINPHPHIFIDFDDNLSEGLYRLSIIPPFETPIIDEKMQLLRPINYTKQFKLVDDGGTLKLESILV